MYLTQLLRALQVELSDPSNRVFDKYRTQQLCFIADESADWRPGGYEAEAVRLEELCYQHS